MKRYWGAYGEPDDTDLGLRPVSPREAIRTRCIAPNRPRRFRVYVCDRVNTDQSSVLTANTSRR